MMTTALAPTQTEQEKKQEFLGKLTSSIAYATEQFPNLEKHAESLKLIAELGNELLDPKSRLFGICSELKEQSAKILSKKDYEDELQSLFADNIKCLRDIFAETEKTLIRLAELTGPRTGMYFQNSSSSSSITEFFKGINTEIDRLSKLAESGIVFDAHEMYGHTRAIHSFLGTIDYNFTQLDALIKEELYLQKRHALKGLNAIFQDTLSHVLNTQAESEITNFTNCYKEISRNKPASSIINKDADSERLDKQIATALELVRKLCADFEEADNASELFSTSDRVKAEVVKSKVKNIGIELAKFNLTTDTIAEVIRAKNIEGLIDAFSVTNAAVYGERSNPSYKITATDRDPKILAFRQIGINFALELLSEKNATPIMELKLKFLASFGSEVTPFLHKYLASFPQEIYGYFYGFAQCNSNGSTYQPLLEPLSQVDHNYQGLTGKAAILKICEEQLEKLNASLTNGSELSEDQRKHFFGACRFIFEVCEESESWPSSIISSILSICDKATDAFQAISIIYYREKPEPLKNLETTNEQP